MKTRSPERIEFLNDLLETAMSHAGYGFFHVVRSDDTDKTNPTVVIEDKDDESETHTVTFDTLTKGLGVIRAAVLQEVTDHDGTHSVYHNKKTGQRLYMSASMRDNILRANRTNGYEGDLDVLDALAVLECGLFGAVVYA